MIGKYIVITVKRFEQNEYLTPINFFSVPWVFQKYAHQKKKPLISEVFPKKVLENQDFLTLKIYKYTMHTHKKGGHWKHLWKSLGRQNFH